MYSFFEQQTIAIEFWCEGVVLATVTRARTAVIAACLRARVYIVCVPSMSQPFPWLARTIAKANNAASVIKT